ncbi:histidine phosphatase family protein [Mycolicibacterium houstonense]|uniref:histidine phosphatase family protein n=1 Tax=Mycolicibacterium houstonense TaxID=146021 RepID=UPI001F3BD955|nr:histidine phosphatase family protein [Mycolicibacterium houstonense]
MAPFVREGANSVAPDALPFARNTLPPLIFHHTLRLGHRDGGTHSSQISIRCVCSTCSCRLEESSTMSYFRRSGFRAATVSIGMMLLAFLLAIPVAHAAEVMRITFIRHGESTANAANIADSSVPGPVLTEKGQQQARDIVKVLGDNNYDAIYASTMVRTQLTAAPMAEYLGLPIQVVPGLQEIEAGIYEGTPESDAVKGYLQAPLKWLQGDLDARIPGSINGREFDARMDGAIQTMYDNGDRNVAAFSHGGAIMFWVFLNAENADPMWLMTNPLRNTGYVVVEGNPEDGWRVVNWNGTEVGPETAFHVEVLRQVRTLSRQLDAAVQQVTDSFATRDPAAIATAINRSIADAAFSVTKFSRAINADIVKRIDKVIPKKEDATADDVQAAGDTAAQQVQSAPAPAVTQVQTKLKARSAAPDLSDRNEAVPGAAKALKRSGDQAKASVVDARERVKSSIEKAGDAVRKAVAKASHADAKPAGDQRKVKSED